MKKVKETEDLINSMSEQFEIVRTSAKTINGWVGTMYGLNTDTKADIDTYPEMFEKSLKMIEEMQSFYLLNTIFVHRISTKFCEQFLTK